MVLNQNAFRAGVARSQTHDSLITSVHPYGTIYYILYIDFLFSVYIGLGQISSAMATVG